MKLLSVLFVIALTAAAASASPVLDQSVVVPSGGISGLAIERRQSVAQTFTVGLDGLLTRVEVQVYQFQEGPKPDLQVEIRLLRDDGLPGLSATDLIVSGTVPYSTLPMYTGINSAVVFTAFDVSGAGLLVTRGTRLGILLRSDGLDIPQWYLWPTPNFGYEGGTAVVYGVDSPEGSAAGGGDLGFRSYVDPSVPEPLSGTLLVLALARFGARLRKRSA